MRALVPMDPRQFLLGAGLFLVLAGLAGFALRALDVAWRSRWLAFDPGQDVFHLLVGVAALIAAWGARDAATAAAWAVGLGTVFLAVGTLGLFTAEWFGYGRHVGWRVETLEKGAHLAVGAWGAYAGAGDGRLSA